METRQFGGELQQKRTNVCFLSYDIVYFFFLSDCKIYQVQKILKWFSHHLASLEMVRDSIVHVQVSKHY